MDNVCMRCRSHKVVGFGEISCDSIIPCYGYSGFMPGGETNIIDAISNFKSGNMYDSSAIDTDGDMVNHPKHYKAKNGMEAIDVIEAFTDGLNGIEATDTGNIIKYALRWKDKNGVEDLKKIVWYTNHLIGYLESENE